MKTMKIKPSHESQGEYVIINESDFDPSIHEAYDDVQRQSEEKAEAAEAEVDGAPKKRGPKPKDSQ